MARERRTDTQALRPSGWVARWLRGIEIAYAEDRIDLKQLEGARAKAASSWGHATRRRTGATPTGRRQQRIQGGRP